MAAAVCLQPRGSALGSSTSLASATRRAYAGTCLEPACLWCCFLLAAAVLGLRLHRACGWAGPKAGSCLQVFFTAPTRRVGIGSSVQQRRNHSLTVQGQHPCKGVHGLPGPSIHLLSPCSARVMCGQCVSRFLLSPMPAASAASLLALCFALLCHATHASSCMGIQDTAHARVCVPGQHCWNPSGCLAL